MCENLVVTDLNVAATALESIVNDYRFTRTLRVKNVFVKQLQQHFIEAAQLHDGAVVLFHEGFHAQPVIIVVEIEGAGQCALVVKQ